MKTKVKKQKEMTHEAVAIPVSFPALNYGLCESFTADNVTIEEPGSLTTHTRAEVEGWLEGMNAARRLGDDAACREAVARTIEGSRKIVPGVPAVAAPLARTAQRSVPTMAALVAAVIFLIGGRTARCQEITPGYSFQDGQQLYASQLQQLVADATITPVFYNNAQTTPVLGSGYYFLILNPANQTYYRINAQQVLYGNTNIFLNAPAEAVPAYGLLLFCDPTNGWVASTTVSNLLWNSASNIDVAGLSFANTNNGGATNAYVLPHWPYPLSGLNTNYPAHFLVFDTNGVPYRISLTNAEVALAFDLGTVISLPYEYEQEFAPWRLYGTNTVAPYTNAFGWTTNFPITAYFQTNIAGTNLPTLLPTDTVPINAGQQGTNTSASIQAIYQYMTNLNALPPYTLARSQFFGPYASWNVTNMSAATGIITNYALAVNFSNAVPVSFAFDQPGQFGQGLGNPYTPNLASNALYWAQVTNQPVLSFQVFTNLANAQARVNPVLGLSGYITSYATLLWLTNFTSVNCAVVQACDATTIEPGVYDCFFLNPSQSPYYYLTGSCQGQTFNWGTSVNFVNFPNCSPAGWPGIYNTNGFEIQTVVNNGVQEPMPLVQILVQPQ